MKKLIAVMLLSVLSLAVPVSIHAQGDNDSARIAAQKRNAKRSHQDVKAGKHTLKKMQKSMGKPKKPSQQQTAVTDTPV